MAVCIQGMSLDETTELTRNMMQSGRSLAWDVEKPVVDKHSTGGVGDKISIPLAPILACCDLVVPMISGRGLGTTGGTLDKLESIDGFRTDLSITEFQEIVSSVGCAISGASAELAPADKRLYAIRDVTATIESVELITASILSKKLAESLDALILDVKFGGGAFMKSVDEAHRLATSLVRTGNDLGVKTHALLTNMNQPLGEMIGNANEVIESIDVLKGSGPADVIELTHQLAVNLLVTATGIDPVAARQKVKNAIDSGEAYEKLCQMVAAQEGDEKLFLNLAKEHVLLANKAGFVSEIDTLSIGESIIELGGGRKVKTDKIDHSVGIQLMVKIGDEISNDQPLMKVFTNSSSFDFSNCLETVKISEEPASRHELIVSEVL